MTEIVIPNIAADVMASLKAKATVFPRRSNWASVIGSPCLRQLVYYRTDWDKLQPPEPGLQGIFDTGTELEPLIIRILNKVGEGATPRWELVSRGVKIKQSILDEYQIGGIPDVYLRVYQEGDHKGTILGPVDVKTMAQHIFDSVHVLDDFQKKPWLKKYPEQLTCYMIGAEYEWGAFLLVNKTNIYDVKLVPMVLNQEMADDVLRKASAVNTHVAAGTKPDKLNDAEECSRCPFNLHCCPEVGTGGAFDMVHNEELEAIMDRMAELDSAATEYDALERKWNKMLEGAQGKNMAIGHWLVSWKQASRTTKPSPGGTSMYWTKTITRLSA